MIRTIAQYTVIIAVLPLVLVGFAGRFAVDAVQSGFEIGDAVARNIFQD